MIQEYIKYTDVLVLGSGPSGFCAAYTASKNGAKVLLVEQAGDVGGISTTGMMSHWTGSCGSPLYYEILRRSAEKNEGDHHGKITITIDPEKLKTLYLEMLDEVGCELLLYTFAEDAIVEGDEVKGVSVINKTGRTRRYDREQIGGTPQTARTPRTPEVPVVDTPRAETPRNIFGEPVIWDEKMSGQRWDNAKRTVEMLTSEFNTKLKEVRPGAKKAAGAVQISGTIMELNNPQTATVVHEFAHTISMARQTKYGLYDEAAFWKEIRKTRNAYRRAVENGTAGKISSYEYAKTGEDAVDEFMAEAFAVAWLEENGIDRPEKYGNDLTFARLVLSIIKKYFGRSNTNVQT